MIIRKLFLTTLALLALATFASLASAEPPKGAIGFTVEVEGDGSFWKPVIKTVRVVGVRAGSPAEAAGLRVGDEILEVQGVEVADANARRVAKLVEVDPGEHLLLRVRSADGETRDVEIIAGQAPQAATATPEPA
ncbi:MAG: PDZ domain-containing protein [Nevskiales bacterium]|nr:PDZ domain-containing protein [Nevskiales bacterium]